MAARLPDAFAGVKNEPAQASPFLHLLAVTSKDDGPLVDLEGRSRVVRLTRNRVAITFGTDDLGAPRVFYPWAFKVGSMRTRSDGSVDGFSVVLANPLNYAGRWVDANDGLAGAVCRIFEVRADLLADSTAAGIIVGKVSAVDFQGFDAIALTIGNRNLTETDIPNELIFGSCRFAYRGPRCGFTADRDPENTLGVTCAHTLAACRQRGQWEVDNGLALTLVDADHPYRYGGYKATPVGSFAV